MAEIRKSNSYQQTTRDILAIFFIKQHVFLMTFFGVVIGAILLMLLTPNQFQTEMQLVVKPFNAKPLVFDEDSTRMNFFNEVTEKSLNTVIFMLTAPEVLREVVIKNHLADPDDEAEILAKSEMIKASIKAEPLTMSSLIKVTIKGREPEAITAQLQTLGDAYIRYHIKINQATEGRLRFFTEQTEHFKKKYENVTNELANASRDMKIVDPTMQKDTGLTLVRDLELSKIQLTGQITALRSKAESLKAAAAKFNEKGQLVGLPAETISAYPALIEMEKSLAQLHINRQRAANDFQPTSKQVQDAETQYASMKAQIKRSMEQIINDLEIQVKSLQRGIQEADEKISDFRSGSLELTGNALRLEQLALEQKLTKDNYTLYSAKQEEARINDEKDRAQFANISIANPPAVPTSPVFPRKGIITALALVVGLMLGLAFSALAYAMEQRIWTPTDISVHTGLRVLGTFDAVSTKDAGASFGWWKRKLNRALAS